MGMLIGYFVRKILKLVIFALGGVFSLLVYLQYQGIIAVNMDKVQNAADRIVTMILICRISYRNAFSDMVMLDVLKSPMLSYVLDLSYINGISLLIRIN